MYICNMNYKIKQIRFEPDLHKYADENSNEYISVTTLIHKVVPQFDSEYWTMYRVVDQSGYNPRPFPDSRKIEITVDGQRVKYHINRLYEENIIPLCKSPNEIKEEWLAKNKESCNWGNKKHDYLENSINKWYVKNSSTVKIHDISNNKGYRFKIESREEIEKSPLKLMYPSIFSTLCKLIDQGYTIYAEKIVYHPTYFIAGTIDVLAVKGKDVYIIDWKTNKFKLNKRSGYYKKKWNYNRTKKIITDKFVTTNDRLKFPLSNIPHSNYWIYTCQLSLYSYILEYWGFKIKRLYLYHIQPKLDKYGDPVTDGQGNRKEEAPVRYEISYLYKDIERLVKYHAGELTDVDETGYSLFM